MKDHSEIEGLIRNTVEALGPMLVDANADVSDFGNKLSTLLNRQRSHLLFEEMNVYPYVAEYLGNEDWREIAALVPDYEQPIFGEQIEKEHKLIFKAP